MHRARPALIPSILANKHVDHPLPPHAPERLRLSVVFIFGNIVALVRICYQVEEQFPPVIGVEHILAFPISQGVKVHRARPALIMLKVDELPQVDILVTGKQREHRFAVDERISLDELVENSRRVPERRCHVP